MSLEALLDEADETDDDDDDDVDGGGIFRSLLNPQLWPGPYNDYTIHSRHSNQTWPPWLPTMDVNISNKI